MNKIYNPIVWVNNSPPALNEDNLNAMSQGLSDLDDRVIELAGDIVSAVSDCNDAVQDASDYADVASAAATTATTKAGEAANSATTASNKATEASGYASTASSSASDALGYKNAAEAAAALAETAITHAPYIGANGNWFVWDATDEEYDDTGVNAEGTDGVSPEVTITSITDGHRVTITDVDHPSGQSFDVTDGTDGTNGISPDVEISNITGGHRVTITDADHPTGQSFNVMDGTGAGDMLASTYDNDSTVANAGGIADYVSSAAMAKANPTGTGSFSLNRRADSTVGTNSFAEGDSTIASGNASHSEGSYSVASALAAHAEGTSQASGQYSHSQNRNTIAQGQNQTALGMWNVGQGSGSSLQSTDYAVIIGNGTDAYHRSNALAVQWDGTVVFQDGTTISSANDFSSAEELAELGLIEDFSKYENAVSVKDYGAVGDGVANDLNAFVEAFADTDYDVVLIPRGTYVLTQPDPDNPTIDIELIGNKTIVGENSNLTTLVNANIVAPYGITAKSITFVGGTKRIVTEGGFPNGIEQRSRRESMQNKLVTIFATPRYSDASVVYENCVFKNTDIASLAFYGTAQSGDLAVTSLVESKATGCVFEDITNCGIWHSVDIESANYTGNVFKNLGGSTVIAGKIWGIALGDISNNTNKQVTDAIITGNVFDTLTTDVDTVTNEYIPNTSPREYNPDYNDINANFIAVVVERVIITGNSLKNLLGYGHDREGIYTKGNDVEIANNLLIECSAGGEGYICTKKKTASKMYHYRLIKIHNNIFQGEYGNAIMCYGSGVIRDNDISIRKMYRAIRGNAIDTAGVMADNVAPISSLIVENNNIICGLGANPDDQSYIPMQVISTGGEYLGGLYFNNNTISVYKQSTYGTRLSAIFKVEKLASDIEIKGNVITQENIGDTTDSALTSGIQLSENDSLHTVLTAAKKINVVIEDNRFPMLRSNGFKLTLNTNPYLTKIFSIKGNIIKKVIVSGSSPTIVYPVDIKESSGNTDILTYDSEQAATEINQSKQVYTTASVVYTALNTSTFFEFDGTTPAVYSDDFKDYLPIATLKTVVAASSDFADFQTRIAAL